jgi:hypothetical protein
MGFSSQSHCWLGLAAIVCRPEPAFETPTRLELDLGWAQVLTVSDGRIVGMRDDAKPARALRRSRWVTAAEALALFD